MAETKDGKPDPKDVIPSDEASWQRHVRILDLLKQIRVARERRATPRRPDRDD